MREFPSFSWFGTHRSVSPSGAPAVCRAERQHSLRSFLRLRLRLEAYPSELVSCGRSHARVPQLQLVWNSPLRFSERRTCGLPGRKATLTAFVPAPAATLGGLSQRTCELWKVPCESSPASAGLELTAPFLHAAHLRFAGQKGNVR